MYKEIVIYAKQIPLTQGKFVMVGYWWYEWLMIWKWYAMKNKKTFYAYRTHRINKRTITIYMHRVIKGMPKNKLIDHKNHDGLNCLPDNIRICTISQNNANTTKRLKASSKYLGVYLFQGNKKETWASKISINSNVISLGYFNTEIEAAKAYDNAAKFYRKEFANLNFK